MHPSRRCLEGDGFSLGSESGAHLLGYRIGHRETKLINYKPVKKDFKVVSIRRGMDRYRPISKRLPLYYEGATPPRPDPGHTISQVAGVAHRVAVEPPKSQPAIMKRFKTFVKDWLFKNLQPLTAEQLLSFDEWLEKTPYSACRKAELRKVWTNADGNFSSKILAIVKCFIKDETYPEYKFHRGIYSRHDLAKCLFGPLVQSISNLLFKLSWFIKTVPVVERPQAIFDRLYKPGSKYTYTDYTAFESHFKTKLMDSCENVLYAYMVKNLGPEVKSVARTMATTKTGKNKLVFKTFTASVKATRMSGEMDTSLSNGFTNLMLYLFASKEAGCDISKIVGYVEGDDGLFRNDGPIPTAEIFESLGMTIKIGITDKLERASFCGQVYDIEDLTVVTDIRDQVCRLGWTNKQYVNSGPKVCLELLRARGFSLAYQYGACPILGAIGETILRLTSKHKIRQSIIDSMDEYSRLFLLEAISWGPQIRNPGIATRILVEEMYNISISEQIEIENRVRAMTKLGPLPFRFREIPEVWVNYYEDYNASRYDEVPVWKQCKTTKALNALLAVGAVKPEQLGRLREEDALG